MIKKLTNTALVFSELADMGEPRTVRQLAEATQLDARQVRVALRHLALCKAVRPLEGKTGQPRAYLATPLTDTRKVLWTLRAPEVNPRRSGSGRRSGKTRDEAGADKDGVGASKLDVSAKLWECPWEVCPKTEAQICRADKIKGCGYRFLTAMTAQQAKDYVRSNSLLGLD